VGRTDGEPDDVRCVDVFVTCGLAEDRAVAGLLIRAVRLRPPRLEYPAPFELVLVEEEEVGIVSLGDVWICWLWVSLVDVWVTRGSS
jgi:hypothetical protein